MRGKDERRASASANGKWNKQSVELAHTGEVRLGAAWWSCLMLEMGEVF